MIYFNPHSGSNSKKHLDRIIDFMQYTNCELDILRTERRNHCKEHINNQLDMKKYQGIVIISGDGLMHEFVNSKAAGVVPVTHVPAGSANAFAKQQMTMAGEAC
jgi:diacylglycerol kinase family enzyme